MGVHISTNYLGDLRCEAQHGPSQTRLLTDAPVDNMGKGESFSPTDLVATALGTCMATTMAIFAKKRGFELPPVRVEVEKIMSADAPRRVAQLVVALHVPLPADHAERAALEGAALNCPVAKSLHPDLAVPAQFHWEG